MEAASRICISLEPNFRPVPIWFPGESSAKHIPDLNEIQAEEIIQAVASAPELLLFFC